MLKIISLNANGIRAAARKGLYSWLKQKNADVRPDWEPGNIEVGDSRTGYLIPARDGPGALPDVDSCWGAAAVIWKMPKYKKMHTFSKMGMSQISRNVNLSEIKNPCGSNLT